MGLEKEDIMALIAILQKGLTDDEEGVKSQDVPDTKSKRKTRTSSNEFSTNKFDSMAERNMHKQDTEIDKKLWGNNQPIERNREFQQVAVQCRVCGKEDTVNSILVEGKERYKCNKCASSSG